MKNKDYKKELEKQERNFAIERDYHKTVVNRITKENEVLRSENLLNEAKFKQLAIEVDKCKNVLSSISSAINNIINR